MEGQAIAFVIHLDEAHRASVEAVDGFLMEVLAACFPREKSGHQIFPVIYVSGLDRLKIQERASVIPSQRILLPLLERQNLDAIVRELFRLGDNWHSRGGLKHAFNCFGGVPRLFLYFLWVLSIPPIDRTEHLYFPCYLMDLQTLRFRLTEYDGCNENAAEPPLDYCDGDLHYCIHQLMKSNLWNFDVRWCPTANSAPLATGSQQGMITCSISYLLPFV
jgi:hypothetical protein